MFYREKYYIINFLLMIHGSKLIFSNVHISEVFKLRKSYCLIGRAGRDVCCLPGRRWYPSRSGSWWSGDPPSALEMSSFPALERLWRIAFHHLESFQRMKQKPNNSKKVIECLKKKKIIHNFTWRQAWTGAARRAP